MARALTKRYGAVVALDRVDLDVAAGESLAVFGPNGAGKTTLTRILATHLRPSAGTLRIAGRDPRRHDRETRRSIGLISHQTFLYDELTARENLVFFGRLYGASGVAQRVEALLDSVGLTERADDPVRTLSRGMQQRLSVARALVHEPSILFLDEPFTGLDPAAAAALATILSGLRQQGRTLVVTTHDLSRGIALCDRWLILARGRVAASGLSAGVDRERFESEYLKAVAQRGRERAGA